MSDDLPLALHSQTQGVSARKRLIISALAGTVLAAICVAARAKVLAPLLGWDATALLYIGWVWKDVRKLNAEATAQMAVAEDPTWPTSDSLLLIASTASLAAVGLVVFDASKGTGLVQLAQIALAIASLVISWATIHTIFMLRYARLYYTGQDGGVEFNSNQSPCYTDFAYLSFTIGMTFQVSDTNLTSARMRITALHQALLSYLFGAVILAAAVNLVAGLGR